MTLEYEEIPRQLSRRSPIVRWGIRVAKFGWVWAGGLGWLAGIALLAWLWGGEVGAVFLVYFGVAFLAGWALARRALHRRRVAAVLSYCARGMRLRAPLPEFLAAASEAERGVLRRRLWWVGRMLEQGRRLDRAIADALPEIDGRQAQVLAEGAELGAGPLEAALVRLEVELSRSGRHPLDGATGMLIYAAGAIATANGAAVLWELFVAPKITSIFRDFGLRARPDRLAEMLPFTAVLGAAGLLAVVAICEVSVLGLTQRRSTAGRVGDLLRRFPVLGRAARDRMLADYYWFAARSIEAGVPAPGFEIGQAGQASAALGRPLPAEDQAVLGTAMSAGGMAAGLLYLAEHRERARERGLQRVMVALAAILMAATAGLLAVILYSVWPPLLALMKLGIDHAAGR